MEQNNEKEGEDQKTHDIEWKGWPWGSLMRVEKIMSMEVFSLLSLNLFYLCHQRRAEVMFLPLSCLSVFVMTKIENFHRMSICLVCCSLARLGIHCEYDNLRTLSAIFVKLYPSGISQRVMDGFWQFGGQLGCLPRTNWFDCGEGRDPAPNPRIS